MLISPLEIPSHPVRILCNETRSRRQLPANFNNADLPLFGDELSMLIPAAKLLELNQVNVDSTGIIFRAGRILAESFNFRQEFIRWASVRNLTKFLARNYGFRTRTNLAKQALWITDNWGSAYFHWLLDALPRLYVVREQLADSTLLLPESCKDSPYVVQSLAAFAVHDFRFIEHNEVLHCRKLLVPCHVAPSGNYNERIIRALRDLFRVYYDRSSDGRSTEKIYITRSKANRRRITNEDEVIEVVKEHGFSVFAFEDYAFEDQVKLMLSARYVVANHGAGLANMLFLSAGSHVLELRRVGDKHNNCYFSLASGLDLRYYYQLCAAENQVEDTCWADVSVDLQCLRRNLQMMLAAA
jgi:capsular polysaccharide biosynthesis protein